MQRLQDREALVERCDRRDDPDDRLKACTALIDDGAGNNVERARFFANRGFALWADSQFDRAGSDFDTRATSASLKAVRTPLRYRATSRWR